MGFYKPIGVALMLPMLAFPLTGQSAPDGARFGEFGLDLAGHDPNVEPGDDFYRYEGGRWLDTNTIPADRSRWGSFDKLDSESEEQVRVILQGLAQGAPAG